MVTDVMCVDTVSRSLARRGKYSPLDLTTGPGVGRKCFPGVGGSIAGPTYNGKVHTHFQKKLLNF